MDTTNQSTIKNSTPLTLTLPPIKELFSQTWSTFLKSLLNLFLLDVLTTLAYIFSFLLAGVIIFFIVFGQGKTLPQSFSQFLSFFKPSLVLPVGITLGGLVAVVGIISLISTIASILFINNAQTPQPFGKTVRQSFPLIIPLFLTSLLVSLISLGGYFLFFLPGLFISFFLTFTTYEVVLSGKRPTEALRGNLHLIIGHFGEILVRRLIFFLLYLFLVVFLPNIILNIEPETGLVLVGLSFIINLLIGWFNLAYSVTPYKQVKSLTDERKPASLKWLVAISLMGWLLAGGVIYATYRFTSSKKGQAFIKNLVMGIKETEKESSALNELANETFLKVNAYRQQKGIPVFKEDKKLCAYASRRLEQLAKTGGFDDNRGFYEDVANPNLAFAYFQDYTRLTQYLWQPVGPNTTTDEIIKAWLGPMRLIKKEKNMITNEDFSYGCIRADKERLIFIGGVRKKTQETQKEPLKNQPLEPPCIPYIKSTKESLLVTSAIVKKITTIFCII